MLESNISEEEIEIKTINHIDKNENSSKSKMILDPPGLSMVSRYHHYFISKFLPIKATMEEKKSISQTAIIEPVAKTFSICTIYLLIKSYFC